MKDQFLPLIVILLGSLALLSLTLANNINERKQTNEEDRVISSARSSFRFNALVEFEKFKSLYHKTYNSLSELARRAKLFMARAWKVYLSRVNYIKRLSSKYFAINDMSDWTEEERDARYKPSKQDQLEEKDLIDLDELIESVEKRNKRDVTDSDNETEISSSEMSDLLKSNDIDTLSEEESSKVADYKLGGFLGNVFGRSRPTHREESSSSRNEIKLDYRHTGCMSPVKNQYHCGACYIFSTISIYEYHYCRQLGQQVSFSEQYLIDCGSRVGLEGCSGGSDIQVNKFAKRFGLELESDYPYRGRDDYSCPFDSQEDYTMGYTRVTKDNIKHVKLNSPDSKIEKALRIIGPLVIGLHLNRDFPDYGGGVDLNENCRDDTRHAMTLIGLGVEDGQEYWLIRNSNGAYWGEDGHYKLSKDVDWRCFMMLSAVMAEFRPNPYHSLPYSS